MVEGTTTIKNEVLSKIAAEAASAVRGVAQVGVSSVGRTIAHAFGGGKITTAGVAVTPGQPGSGETSFELTISAVYGASIPDVAREIREAIETRIAEITGLTVRRINIYVEDIKAEGAEGRGFILPFVKRGDEDEKEKLKLPSSTELPA
jgi:uncharacterized alkaline shock family protein YloU